MSRVHVDRRAQDPWAGRRGRRRWPDLDGLPVVVRRHGVIMRPNPRRRAEAWGVFNPGGARSREGELFLFPRRVAAGNISRVSRARVLFNEAGAPVGAVPLEDALRPREPYELAPTTLLGGVEDPRVTYVRPLDLFVMTYTAYRPPFHPRVAVATSRDLVSWTRLGPVEYAHEERLQDLNVCGNKNAVFFPDAVLGPDGRSSLAMLHRPAYGSDHPESIWISYVPLERALADHRELARVEASRLLMSPAQPWERLKIGAGAPPVRTPAGWVLIYHGVSGTIGKTRREVRYCAGLAILDLDDPTTVLLRKVTPIIAPEEPYERQGVVANVVFPTAIDVQAEGRFDVYYGAADSVIAAANLSMSADGL